MNNENKANYYGVPIYALNELAKNIKGGRFVTVDESNHLVLHYTPYTKDMWLINKYDVNDKGILVNIDTSGEGDYWSIPHDFMKTCNEVFTFTKNEQKDLNVTNTSTRDGFLLTYFFNGIFDGKFGEEYKSSSKELYWFEIKDNKIIRYKQRRSNLKIDGYEFEDVLQNPEIIEKWTTHDEILSFLRNNGWMLKDDSVVEYSVKHISRKLNNG